MSNDDTREIIIGLLRLLVSYPNSVRVVRIPSDDGMEFEIHVELIDRDLLFGFDGLLRNEFALLMAEIGMQSGQEVRVNIVDPVKYIN